MTDLDAFEARIGGLLAAIGPDGRRSLARTLAARLRASQSDRIAAQRNPDGTPYAPRKPQGRLRRKAGAIRRRAMFSRLRTGKWLKAEVTPQAAAVTFLDGVQRMAQVHQHGLRDRVNKSGLMADYPARGLLGFSAADMAMIEDLLVDHLAGGKV